MTLKQDERQDLASPDQRRIASSVLTAACVGFVALAPFSAAAADGDAAPATPSTGETVMFNTPQLHNVAHPEVLQYRYEKTGPNPVVDQVGVSIDEIHPDGTKYVSFDFLTGANHTFYPAVDHFSGNPLLMVFLEHDVNELKAQTGIAAAHFRDDVRAGFAEAKVSDTTIDFDGKKVPAREVVVTPFSQDDRLTKLHSFQVAEYHFVVADDVPGGIASMSVAMPADTPSGAVPWSEKITFTGVKK